MTKSIVNETVRVNRTENPTKSELGLAQIDNTVENRLPYGVALVIWLLCLLIHANYSFYAVFTIFEPWDDEGFLMITEQHFLQGHALYTDMYSQYGPAFYLFSWVGHTLGIPLTHDAVRFVGIGIYLVISGALSWVALRLTKSVAAMVVAQVVVFTAASCTRWEPGHPQTTCLILITIAVCAISLYKPERPRSWLFLVIGICGGCLAGTKLNLGFFFVLGGILTALWGMPIPAKGSDLFRKARVVLSVMAAFFPLWYLRHKLASEGIWVGTSITTAILLCLWRTPRVLLGSVRYRDIGLGAVGFLLGFLIPIVFVFARGSTLPDILWGILLQHVQYETVFYISINIEQWRYIVSISAPLIMAFLVFSPVSRKWRERYPSAITTAFSVFKLGFSLAFCFSVDYAVGGQTVPLLPTILWLLLVPSIHRSWEPWEKLTRVFLVFVGAFEVLWLYPVAGNQLGCATVLPALVAACVFGDVFEDILVALKPKLPPVSRLFERAVIGGITTLVASLALMMHILDGFSLRDVYFKAASLDLPGARVLHLEKKDVLFFQELTAYLKKNSDAVIMFPGMNSFFFWMEEDAPTTWLSAGRWMTLLSDAEMERVIREIEELEKTKRVVVLYNKEISDFWTSGYNIWNRPLVKYLTDNYRHLDMKFDKYLILTRSSRINAPGGVNAQTKPPLSTQQAVPR